MAEKEREVMEAAMEAGHILLENGAEIFRVEETINRICRHYGVESSNAFVLSNGIFVTSGGVSEEIFAKVQNKLHYNNQQRAYGSQNIHTRTAAHTYCGCTPYDCGGGEPVQAFSAEENYAGPQESDTGNNLRGNTGGVAEFVECVAYAGKQCRSKPYGKMRAHARFLLTARAFDTYRQSKQTAYSYS